MHVLAAIGVYAAVLAAVLGLGAVLLPRSILERLDPALCLAAVLSCGLVAVVVVVLAAGYVDVLRTALLVVLGVVGLVALASRRALAAKLATDVSRAMCRRDGGERAVLGVIAACVALAFAAALKHPFMADELDYHWSAPLYWAAAHQWVRSPYVLTNGPSFMEWLYTLPALTGSYQAAHWLHGTTFVLLILAAASIARSLRSPWVLVTAGVASIPLALQQASWAYNDVAAASFVATALALALSREAGRAGWWLAGVALAAAAATKLFMLAAVPMLLVALLVQRPAPKRERALELALAVAGVPLAVVVALSLRCYAITGRLTDLGSQHIVRYGSPGWQFAGGFVPDLHHTPLLPFEPFFTGVIGNQEPYGGRTGIVLLLALPLAIGVLVRRRRIERRALVPLAGAYTFLLIVGVVAPRTRYLLPAYVLLTVFVFAVVGGVADARFRRFLPWAVAAAAGLGFLDAAHVAVRDLHS